MQVENQCGLKIVMLCFVKLGECICSITCEDHIMKLSRNLIKLRVMNEYLKPNLNVFVSLIQRIPYLF